MPPNEIKQLKEKLEENNKILKNLQTRFRYATIFSVVKWVIYIGIAIGAYTLLKPVVDQVIATYQAIKNSSVSQIDFTGVDFTSILDIFNKPE